MLQPNQYTPATHSPVSYGRQFIRLRHVEAKCGFKRSHIYNLIKLGDFPTPIKIGARAVAWDVAEVEQWMVRIPVNVTGHSGDRDRFAHGLHAGTCFVL